MAALKVRSKEEKKEEALHKSKTSVMQLKKPKYFKKPFQSTVKAELEENLSASEEDSIDDQLEPKYKKKKTKVVKKKMKRKVLKRVKTARQNIDTFKAAVEINPVGDEEIDKVSESH